MPHDFDIVSVGNAKIDIFLTLHEANKHLRLSKETNELCVKFGEKIAVEKADVLLGGNAANVAVGTSRLGLKSAIVAEIGNDEFAQIIINTLSKENVNISNVLRTEGQPSSFSTILNLNGERTIFSEHVKRDHDLNFENISAKWVYLTSLGEDWENAYSKAVDFAKKTNCKLAFNPGTLQIKCGKEDIKNVLTNTELLFTNKEEGEELLCFSQGQKNVEDILAGLQQLGPKTVVITDGKNGSFTIDDRGTVLKRAVIDTEIVEKTGAGDAYSSGFLSAIINNKSITEAMDWGTKNSTSVVGRVGATAGLLYQADLKK